jgi:hypothetical protein
MAPTANAYITKTEATADRVNPKAQRVADLDSALLGLTDEQLSRDCVLRQVGVGEF